MVLEHLKDFIENNIGHSYKTGLVLSGGAARGFAHLGVLKALREENIYPEILVGVSAGAIVGGFYADGFEPEEVLEIFQKHKVFSIVEFSFKKQSLFKLTGLEKILKDNLRSKNIEDLKLPFLIGATDISEGKSVYFDKGNLVDAILTSSSIPVIFPPVKTDGMVLVDGGVTNNFPIELLEKRCKQIIGSHVNPTGKFDTKKGVAHIALQAFHLGIAANIEQKKKRIKYFIEPKGLEEYSYYDVEKAKEMFDLGYKATKEVIPSKVKN